MSAGKMWNPTRSYLQHTARPHPPRDAWRPCAASALVSATLGKVVMVPALLACGLNVNSLDYVCNREHLGSTEEAMPIPLTASEREVAKT
jgi:hypothetical protein